jgi:hypothetical protein
MLIILLMSAATACSSGSRTGQQANPFVCGNGTAAGAVSYRIGWQDPTDGIRPTVLGTEAKWDLSDATALDPNGWIALGPEDTGEPLAQLGMTMAAPTLNAAGNCIAPVVTAVLSTTDVRVGTAQQLIARLYERVGPEAGAVVFETIGPREASGSFLVSLQRVIITPNMPPTTGETITVSGTFVAR